MTPFQLKLALKSHGMHVYEDTGGIYTTERPEVLELKTYLVIHGIAVKDIV